MKLKEICLLNPKPEHIDDSLPVSFVPMAKVGERGEFDPSEIKTYQEVKKGFTYFENGDVLFAKITPCMENGKGAIARGMKNGRGFGSTEFHVLRPNPKLATSKWLFYLLSWTPFRKEAEQNMTGSAGQKRVPKQFLEEYSCKLPSLPEQKNITDLFDRAQSIITLRQEQLRVLEELVKLRFQEMFGNHDLNNVQEDWKPISAIGTVVGGATPKTSVAEYWDGEYRWITPAELDNEAGYIFDSVRKLTELGVRSCSLKEMPIGTVILSSRAPIGKVAIAGNTFYCNQGFKNIICNEEIHPMFLYTLLRMNTEYLISLGRGATFKEITKSIVENIRIPVPRKETQEKFATFVQKVDELKFVVQKSIDETQLLFDSLMQKYFS